MRRMTALLAALGLLLAACGDDDAAEDRAASTTTEETTTSSAPSTSDPIPDDADRPPLDLTQSCTSPEGFSISYPERWDAVADCGQFGPAPVSEPAPSTDERPGVVSAFVDPVPFSEVSAPSAEERDRAVTTVDGLQAVRVEAVASGEGLYPAGTETVRWLVDLSVGADDAEPGTLFIDAVDVQDDVDFADAILVLDAMARSIDVASVVADPTVIARYEGGGAPFAVTATPAATQDSTCFAFTERDAEPVCVDDLAGTEPDDDAVAIAALDGPGVDAIVGVTRPGVWSVTVSRTSGGESFTFLPVPYRGRDTRAFALPLPLEEIGTITLRSIDGETLAEVGSEQARQPAGS